MFNPFIFNYNNTNNQFMITLITKNSSYEIQASYNTSNITFPKPVFVFDFRDNIPDPFTGVVLELIDKVSGQRINDATLLMYYYDEQLGNKSTVMKNVGGGRYHSLLPTNDIVIQNYFNEKNLLLIISQQSDALLELTRTCPIPDICSQIPETEKEFCSFIMADMITKIPNSLNTVSKYIANIPIITMQLILEN